MKLTAAPIFENAEATALAQLPSQRVVKLMLAGVL